MNKLLNFINLIFLICSFQSQIPINSSLHIRKFSFRLEQYNLNQFIKEQELMRQKEQLEEKRKKHEREVVN